MAPSRAIRARSFDSIPPEIRWWQALEVGLLEMEATYRERLTHSRDNEGMTDEKPPAQVARPKTLRVPINVNPASVFLRPNMWAKWANIAIRAEAPSWRARNRGVERSEAGPYVAFENEESRTAVTAVRHAFHHLWLDWRDLGDAESEKELPPSATTDTPEDVAAFETWLEGIAAVVLDRDRVVHHPEPSEPTAPHPLGTNVSQQAAYFTAERATDAVDRLLDFLTRVLAAPGIGLEQWAAKRQHVVQGFLDLREHPFLPE